MKLATFLDNNTQSFGPIIDGRIIDIPKAWRDGPKSILDALRAGPDALARISELAAAKPAAGPTLEEAQLLAPIPQPPKVIGLAVNYVEHHREFDRGHDLPDDPKHHTTPRPFIMPVTAVIGDRAEIPWPSFSRQIDYEVELAVVIGAEARCVSAETAPQYIAGYTIANDISARSVTHDEGRTERPKDAFFDWLHGKWADGFCPMGPCLVTADEIPDPDSLDIELAVNGETRQNANTNQMIFPVSEIVSFVSHIMTLMPGDVIATGTPCGVGKATNNFLASGDVMTCRIEGIGELTNTLGQPPEEFYTPCR